MDDHGRRVRRLRVELIEGEVTDLLEKTAALAAGLPRREFVQGEDPHPVPVGMGEIGQGGIAETDPVRAAAEAQDQFPVLPDDGLPFGFRSRPLQGDFRLSVGRGDPFQDGGLP